jgi:hypothetical protein
MSAVVYSYLLRLFFKWKYFLILPLEPNQSYGTSMFKFGYESLNF